MHRHFDLRSSRFVALFLVLVLTRHLLVPPSHADPPSTTEAPQYRVASLGVSRAGALNNRGQLLGFEDNPDGTKRLFLWQGDRMVELKALSGRALSADSLSDTGVILGEMHARARERDEETGKMTPVEHRYAYDTRTHLLVDLDTFTGHRRFITSGMASQVRLFDIQNGQDYLLDGGRRVAAGALSGGGGARRRG